MEEFQTKAAGAFLYGVELFESTKTKLGFDKVDHNYKIIETCRKGIITYVKYVYIGKTYIIVSRDPKYSFEELFPIYPPVKEDLDANKPVIVTKENGDDITDLALEYAGPKGNFYADTPYYVRLRDISDMPITIMDSDMEEHHFNDLNEQIVIY